MSKPLSLEEAALRYARAAEYAKRLYGIARRCRCLLEEEAEYDEYGRMYYSGNPSCRFADGGSILTCPPTPADPRHNNRDKWCSRCRRAEKLWDSARKARVREYNHRRGLLGAAKRHREKEALRQ